MTALETILLVFAAVFAFISLFKGVKFRAASVIVIILTLGFSIFLMLSKRDKEERERKEQELAGIETLNQIGLTQSKQDSALASIVSLQKSTNQIVDSLRIQLGLQKSISSASKTLLTETQNLLSRQKATFYNVDRILNPVFPADIDISISIPFSNPQIEHLIPYYDSLRQAYKKRPRGLPEYMYPSFKNLGEAHNANAIGITIENFDSLFGKKFKDGFPLRRYITFRIENKNYLDLTSKQRGFEVDFSPQKEYYYSLGADFENRQFTLKLRMNDFRFFNLKHSIVNFGSHDLINSSIQIQLFDLWEYMITAVHFEFNLGKGEYLTLNPIEKEMFTNTSKRRNRIHKETFYVHTITQRDFRTSKRNPNTFREE